MERQISYKFSNEQLKKINYLLPKGYKFVAREQIIKKDVPKLVKKKTFPLPTASIPTINPAPNKIKVQKVKEEQYEPKIKLPAPIPTPTVNPNDPPCGTSQKLLQKLKNHQVFIDLMKISKTKESEISLRQIQQKVMSIGQKYRTYDLESDISSFCLQIYKNFAKTSSEYKLAADLQNYLLGLMKIEKYHDLKKSESNQIGLQRMNSSQNLNVGRKKPQTVNRNVYQPLAESKLPTPAQKRILGQMIKRLPSQSLQQVCYIIFQSTENKDYIFDLDTLHVKKFRQLQQYVKKHMQKLGEWEQRTYEDEQFSNESIFLIEDQD